MCIYTPILTGSVTHHIIYLLCVLFIMFLTLEDKFYVSKNTRLVLFAEFLKLYV